jgi:3-deoxy-D-manno-octulosonic-acid transferase
MRFLYHIAIKGYGAVLSIASWFNPKAKLWIDGRKNWQKKLAVALENANNKKRIWIHCASVGEFEQGRPVIEQIKAEYPEAHITLSFFSPSGFELRKDYNKADLVCYLPLDTPKNAKKWVKTLKPDLALFVKYEFWPNMLLALQKQEIPTLYFSSIFRENQHFFKWYGSWFKKILQNIPFIFVQQQKSIDLLNSIGIKNCAIAGDTRFDRVCSIANNIKPISFIEAFITNEITLIAGSTWPEDEKLLANLMLQHKNVKLIIAPHEIDTAHINQIEKRFGKQAMRYSKVTIESLKHSSVLIIDNIGMLSSLYQYADITYIGGGFGKGIHNTLEAAVYGSPILFGPNYSKFQEALDLISYRAAFSIKNYVELQSKFEILLNNDKRNLAGKAAKMYVSNNTGGALKVMDWINTNLHAESAN